jgi:hypothetical protein
MQLVFSAKSHKQIKPLLSPPSISVSKENKSQVSRDIILFTPTPIPSPFQFMIQRIQYENPHCNSCGK